MSSSAHVDNKKEEILVLVKEPTQGLKHTLAAGKMYSANFTVARKKFCLIFHYNWANSYLFVNGKEIVATALCLGNISKDWTIDNIKKTGLNGYVYEFRVDYDAFKNSVDINTSIPLSHSFTVILFLNTV